MAAYVGLSQHIDFARLQPPGDRFELRDMIGEGKCVVCGMFKLLFLFYWILITLLSTCIICWSHHHVCEYVFAGTYGEVYSAIDKTTGKLVAIKILETITDNLEEIEEEYLVLRDLSHHPNLPSFIGMFLRKGVCFEDDQLWFVMEVSCCVHQIKHALSKCQNLYVRAHR